MLTYQRSSLEFNVIQLNDSNYGLSNLEAFIQVILQNIFSFQLRFVGCIGYVHMDKQIIHSLQFLNCTAIQCTIVILTGFCPISRSRKKFRISSNDFYISYGQILSFNRNVSVACSCDKKNFYNFLLSDILQRAF